MSLAVLVEEKTDCVPGNGSNVPLGDPLEALAELQCSSKARGMMLVSSSDRGEKKTDGGKKKTANLCFLPGVLLGRLIREDARARDQDKGEDEAHDGTHGAAVIASAHNKRR